MSLQTESKWNTKLIATLRQMGKVLLVCIVSLAAVSCTPRNKNSEPLPDPPKDFHLHRGDTINIRFLYWPELNDTQVIRPDGRISLQMVGDILAAGLTPEELDEWLEHQYSKYLRQPEIVIVTRDVPTQRVYVGGAVQAPGAVQLVESLTVMQAIMVAGGFEKDSAELKSVIVVRFHEGRRYATSFDLSKGFTEMESDPFYLASNDVVYVPQTYISEINLWVTQNIEGIMGGFIITPTPISGRVGFRNTGR